jgi:hypothetical protein
VADVRAELALLLGEATAIPDEVARGTTGVTLEAELCEELELVDAGARASGVAGAACGAGSGAGVPLLAEGAACGAGSGEAFDAAAQARSERAAIVTSTTSIASPPVLPITVIGWTRVMYLPKPVRRVRRANCRARNSPSNLVARTPPEDTPADGMEQQI